MNKNNKIIILSIFFVLSTCLTLILIFIKKTNDIYNDKNIKMIYETYKYEVYPEIEKITFDGILEHTPKRKSVAIDIQPLFSFQVDKAISIVKIKKLINDDIIAYPYYLFNSSELRDFVRDMEHLFYLFETNDVLDKKDINPKIISISTNNKNFKDIIDNKIAFQVIDDYEDTPVIKDKEEDFNIKTIIKEQRDYLESIFNNRKNNIKKFISDIDELIYNGKSYKDYLDSEDAFDWLK